MSMRVRPRSPPSVRPPNQGLLQRPGEQRPANWALEQPAASLEEIQHILGIQDQEGVRCFARRDGGASAYCTSNGGASNEEAVQLARVLGIPLPAEALPLRDKVLFLGPAVRKYSNL